MSIAAGSTKDCPDGARGGLIQINRPAAIKRTLRHEQVKSG
jgi:hypothetical protein